MPESNPEDYLGRRMLGCKADLTSANFLFLVSSADAEVPSHNLGTNPNYVEDCEFLQQLLASSNNDSLAHLGINQESFDALDSLYFPAPNYQYLATNSNEYNHDWHGTNDADTAMQTSQDFAPYIQSANSSSHDIVMLDGSQEDEQGQGSQSGAAATYPPPHEQQGQGSSAPVGDADDATLDPLQDSATQIYFLESTGRILTYFARFCREGAINAFHREEGRTEDRQEVLRRVREGLTSRSWPWLRNRQGSTSFHAQHSTQSAAFPSGTGNVANVAIPGAGQERELLNPEPADIEMQ